MPRQGRTLPCGSALCCPCSFLEHSEPAPVMLLSRHIPGVTVILLEKVMEEEESSI